VPWLGGPAAAGTVLPSVHEEGSPWASHGGFNTGSALG